MVRDSGEKLPHKQSESPQAYYKKRYSKADGRLYSLISETVEYLGLWPCAKDGSVNVSFFSIFAQLISDRACADAQFISRCLLIIVRIAERLENHIALHVVDR